MGCDSLGTVSRPMIDPRVLLGQFFEPTGSLRLDESGKPVLNTVAQVIDLTDSVPFDHMTDVDKLISLEPLAMGVMFTGITAVGDRTVKSLLNEFKRKDRAFDPRIPNYTVKSVGKRLLEHLSEYYQDSGRISSSS